MIIREETKTRVKNFPIASPKPHPYINLLDTVFSGTGKCNVSAGQPVTGTECVYCAVRNKYLNIIEVKLSLQCVHERGLYKMWYSVLKVRLNTILICVCRTQQIQVRASNTGSHSYADGVIPLSMVTLYLWCI